MNNKKNKRTKVRSEDDQFDDRLVSDPRFVKRIQKARASLKAGKGRRLEDVRKS